MNPLYIDLFAGPGGWDQGILDLGIRPLGIEWDSAACETARAAGHERLQADIADLDPHDVTDGRPVRGLIASPPCQGFSMAGKGKGREDTALLLEHLGGVNTLADLTAALDVLREQMTDARSLLALEPLRWALTLTPSWLAWEQVPAVLPLWDACAVVLRRLGYSVETGLLTSEMFGVPQTRKRAILVARAPWFTRSHGLATLPVPTHSRYHPRTPAKIDEGMPRWVSMADALGRAPLVPGREAGPAPTIGGWVLRNGNQAHSAERATDTPAPTIHFAERQRVVTWEQERNSGPGAARAGRPVEAAPSFTVRAQGSGSHPSGTEWVPVHANAGEEPADTDWVDARPSPTIVGSFAPDVVAAPGYRGPGDGPRQKAKGSVRVTVAEAAVLQSFPADYPWRGSKTAQYRQVGDAVPPRLARAIVAAVADAVCTTCVDLAAALVHPERTMGYYTGPDGPALTWHERTDGQAECIHAAPACCMGCIDADVRLQALTAS